jgi:CIC family chloride channel protein
MGLVKVFKYKSIETPERMGSQRTEEVMSRLGGAARVRLDRFGMTERGLFLITAIFIGAIAGMLSYLLRWCIGHLTALATGVLPTTHSVLIIALPVIGFVATSLFMRRGIHTNISHSVSHIVQQLREHSDNMDAKLIYSPIIANTLTLGLGGSAGAEGPISEVGASLGGCVGRWLKFDAKYLPLLIGCGAGAGIAGIFLAPVGGAMFAIELLPLEFSTMTILGLFLATVTSTIVATALVGSPVDMLNHSFLFLDKSLLIYAIGFGVLCALYSVYYRLSLGWFGELLSRIKSEWVMSSVAGLSLGVMLWLYPSLYGEGYPIMGKLINSDMSPLTDFCNLLAGGDSTTWLLTALAGMLLVKSLAVAATTYGGVAGDFAPVWFAGCMLGVLFALSVNNITFAHLPVGVFALLGMAGVMAGVTRAPLMAIFLVAEMTDSFSLVLPITIVVIISYCASRMTKNLSKDITL